MFALLLLAVSQATSKVICYAFILALVIIFIFVLSLANDLRRDRFLCNLYMELENDRVPREHHAGGRCGKCNSLFEGANPHFGMGMCRKCWVKNSRKAEREFGGN